MKTKAKRKPEVQNFLILVRMAMHQAKSKQEVRRNLDYYMEKLFGGRAA
jgi:hypothetical protein